MGIVIASGFGTSVRVTASVTFPQGFTVTAFADDADSLDIPELQIADSGMGLNGHHVVWAKPGTQEVTLNLIPGTDEDRNMEILFDANRVAEGKTVAGDEVTLVVTYPDGQSITLGQAICLSSLMAKPVAQTGRFKSRPYKFRFATMPGRT